MPTPKKAAEAARVKARAIAADKSARLNYCGECGAANPTAWSDPFPTRCASCGSPMAPPPAWVGRPRAQSNLDGMGWG